MRIAYENSKGEIFEFTNNKKIRIRDADFHKYSYGYESTESTFGVKLKRFKMDPCIYPVKLLFYGSASNREKQMNDLHDAAAFDRANKKTGKLIRGDWYIESYAIEGDTYPYEEQTNVTVEDISFLCPYPFWIREKTFRFLPQSQEQSSPGMDFPCDFPLDFAPAQSGIASLEIDHYAESHFLMYIYGPCTNPRVTINGYPYQIYATLESNDYLIIDSRNHTVVKYLANGTTANLYNSRAFKQSVFKKIPCGKLTVNWPGTFGFDLKLFLERSEPKW